MAKMIDTPDGPVEFPDTMGDAEITAALRKQFPAPAAPQPESFMRRAARFDIGRDAITPALTALTNALAPSGPKVGMGGLNEGIAKAIVPQTPAQGLLAAAPPIGNLAQGAGKLLKPALGRIGLSTGAGAAGGALGPEGAVGGAAQGLGAGLLGEGVGYAAGKLARSLPGAEQAIAKSDLTKITREAQKAVPSFRNVPGVDLGNPAQAKDFAASNRGGSILSEMMENAGAAIDRRIRGQRIAVPELGQEPMSIREAWRNISELGQAGYGGSKANPTQRVMTALEEREARSRALDQVNRALVGLDPSGGAAKLFNEARQQYSTGTAYLDQLGSGAWANKGAPMLDVPKVQQAVGRERGELAHLGPGGEIAGGKMASPERTYTAPRGEATVDLPQAPKVEKYTESRVLTLPEPTFPPAPPQKPDMGSPTREPMPGPVWPHGRLDLGQMADTLTKHPPGRPIEIPLGNREMTRLTEPGSGLQITPAPPPASVTIPGRNDFDPMVGALHRGGGLGEMDYDWVSNLLPGVGMGSGLGRFVLRGAGMLPNIGRVYAGQTPRTLPGGAQQTINYELLKAIQGITGSAAP